MPDVKPMPMTAERLAKWWTEIDAGLKVRREWERWWEANLDAYAPSRSKDPKAYGADINTNRDYSLVERKKSQLFFQTPEVAVKASPLLAQAEDAVAIHQDLLNEYLGQDRADVKATALAALFDLLCPAGIGVTKMGFESVSEDIEQEIPVPDPKTGQPAMDPMTGQPITVVGKVPVPIWERLFWDRVSPKQYIIPATWASTQYDKAPWQATQFSMVPSEIRTRYGVTLDDDAVKGGDSLQEQTLAKNPEAGDGNAVEGIELWYRACLVDPKVKHPERLRLAVLVRGYDTPLVHKDSPYQTVDPKTGGLTPDSLVGYPLHPMVLRVQSDESWLPSDCSISRPQVNELNRFREQQIKMRDSNISLRIVNADMIPRESFEAALQQTDMGDFVFLPGDAFAQDTIKEIAKATYPRENMIFEDKQDADIARTHGLDANQAGVMNEDRRTATESQLVQVNANVLLEAQRAGVVDWYTKGVTKFSTLVQRFVTVEQAAIVLGPEKAQRWAQVMKMTPA